MYYNGAMLCEAEYSTMMRLKTKYLFITYYICIQQVSVYKVAGVILLFILVGIPTLGTAIILHNSSVNNF